MREKAEGPGYYGTSSIPQKIICPYFSSSKTQSDNQKKQWPYINFLFSFL
jgi:hypothetical protein